METATEFANEPERVELAPPLVLENAAAEEAAAGSRAAVVGNAGRRAALLVRVSLSRVLRNVSGLTG